MSEPYWVPLSAQPVDYEGAYAAGTQYVPGDVVVMNGVAYLAVNPSLGQTPPVQPVYGTPVIPLVTALPASPFDGQEAILVDSLTNPSYQWRFRYNAGSSSPYKWEFVGGNSPEIRVDTAESTTTLSTWLDLTTVGPRFFVPRAGDYSAWGGANYYASTVGNGYVDFTKSGNAGASAANLKTMSASEPGYVLASRELIGLVVGDDIRMRYHFIAAATHSMRERWMRVQPVRVS